MDSGYQILQYFQNLMDLSELESGMIRTHPVRLELHHLLTGIVGGYKIAWDQTLPWIFT